MKDENNYEIESWKEGNEIEEEFPRSSGEVGAVSYEGNNDNVSFPSSNSFNAPSNGSSLAHGGFNKNNDNFNLPNSSNSVNSKNKEKLAKGQKMEDKNKKAPAQGVAKKENDKNDSNNKSNNKSNINNNNKPKEKDPAFDKKSNPASLTNKTGNPALGSKPKVPGSRGSNNSDNNPLKKAAGEGIKKAWMALPVQMKIAVVAVPLVIIIAIVVLVTIFASITGGVVSSLCVDSSSDYNGPMYEGSAEAVEFLCSAQNPLGDVRYTTTSKVKERWGRMHEGIDLGISVGTPLYAVQAGTIEYAGIYGGGGNTIIINHGNGIKTLYMHQKDGGFKVKKGDKVGKGQRIGTSGNTGRSTGPHLHYQLNINGKYQKAVNSYFFEEGKSGVGISEDFKEQCGASFDGELAGDSANAINYPMDEEYGSALTSGLKCCDESTTGVTSGNYCVDGITLEGVGTLSLDDYVAGVVTAENAYRNTKDPENMEAMKAQAIAARTYAVNSTKNCTKAIGNSQAAQVYKEPSERAKQAAMETSGGVMTYNGKVFSAQYDAFCINDGDCSSAKCTGNSCTSKYLKVPSNEIHEITVKDPHSAPVVSGVYNDKGHAHGMSQLVARQMQDEGYTYADILKYFYAEGVTIPGAVNQCLLGKVSIEGGIWYYNQIDYNQRYGTYGTIASHGCGPTAMAIAISSLFNEAHDPVELTNYACATQSSLPRINASAKIAATARKLAWPHKTPSKKWKYPKGSATPAFKEAINRVYPKRKWGPAPRVGASCDVFVGTVVRASGYDRKYPRGLQEQYPHIRKDKTGKWKRVSHDDIRAGDVLAGGSHTLIYLGNNFIAEAGYENKWGMTGKVRSIKRFLKRGSKGEPYGVYRATGITAVINRSKTNYCSSNGTSHAFFSAVAKDYGLKSKRVSRKNAKKEILPALNAGKSIVIAIMGPGHFTNGGHFITLTGYDGDNKVFVHDPNNGKGRKTNKLWDFDTIINETANNTDKPFWIISR